jgi:hypothetical protein
MSELSLAARGILPVRRSFRQFGAVHRRAQDDKRATSRHRRQVLEGQPRQVASAGCRACLAGLPRFSVLTVADLIGALDPIQGPSPARCMRTGTIRRQRGGHGEQSYPSPAAAAPAPLLDDPEAASGFLPNRSQDGDELAGAIGLGPRDDLLAVPAPVDVGLDLVGPPADVSEEHVAAVSE